jgi:hypothetical protein
MPTKDVPTAVHVQHPQSEPLVRVVLPAANKTCESYGVGTDGVDIGFVDPHHVSKGVILKMNESKLSTAVELTLSCVNTAFPEGHILWNTSATITNNTLKVSGMANEVRLTKILPPTDRTWNFSASQGRLQLNLNLNEYTRRSGWVTTVKMTETRPGIRSLLYNPCGTMTCPPGTHCQGIDDAPVWLCMQECDEVIYSGYGLLRDETYSRISLQMLRFNKVETDRIHFWLYLYSYLTILGCKMAGSKCPNSNRRGQR